MTAGGPAVIAGLPSMPVVDLRAGGPADAVGSLRHAAQDIMDAARSLYTPAGMWAGDAVSKAWLRRNANPYLEEIEDVARALGRNGGHLLNCSYEWACTSGTRPAPGGGHLMVRVLDWSLDGLGRNAAAFRHRGPAGEWVNLGWPSFVGCITGTAPGRFAAAINQPPLPGTGFGLAVDWTVARPSIWRSRALPPAHLLRKVFDEAETYAEAVRILSETAISTPAFFTIAGPSEGQGCVVERTATDAAIREAAPCVAVANHWSRLKPEDATEGRGDSRARQAALSRFLDGGGEPLLMDWLRPPILNAGTRLVAVLDPGAGTVFAQGWEGGAEATRPLWIAPAG